MWRLACVLTALLLAAGDIGDVLTANDDCVRSLDGICQDNSFPLLLDSTVDPSELCACGTDTTDCGGEPRIVRTDYEVPDCREPGCPTEDSCSPAWSPSAPPADATIPPPPSPPIFEELSSCADDVDIGACAYCASSL